MSFFEAIKNVFNNYANFSGRARRREYWLFFLFRILVVLLFGVIGVILLAEDVDPDGWAPILISLFAVFLLGSIIPTIAVCCRRLHDIGKSGAYVFFYLIPVVGEILILVWAFQDGDPGHNQYGADPKKRMKRVCIYCHSIIPDDFSTCPSCGQPIERISPPKPSRNCRFCGASIDQDSKFCPNCGKGVDDEDPKPAPEPHKNCRFCGASIDKNSKFCPNCGKSTDGKEPEPGPKPVPKPGPSPRNAICPYCGARQGSDVINCKYCGTPMK
ncbi:MAG: DUF805 domain-containing protein [Lachnospiraceae bacterium]|nr:DUF805 domain-containing protein [Lachnospiraceae bacterium]